MAKVLIVDDSPLILDMLEMVCSNAGFDVVTCEAFDELSEVVSRETPDVIVSDLNMPGMPLEDDPVASLAAMVESVPPIVIVSGRPQAELDSHAKAIGAKGSVSKDAGMMGMASILPDLLKSLI